MTCVCAIHSDMSTVFIVSLDLQEGFNDGRVVSGMSWHPITIPDLHILNPWSLEEGKFIKGTGGIVGKGGFHQPFAPFSAPLL